MTAWIAFYVVLTLMTWAALYPMFRVPRPKVGRIPEVLYADVPDTTFDPRGFF